jgi:two-component system OmpR family response regulator
MVAMKTNKDMNEFQTVLIVSKDTETTRIWESLFKRKNYYVISETSPEEAVQSAMLITPALIVLDLVLPEAKKLDLCRNLRGSTNGALLLLSSPGNDQNFFEYSHAGVDEYIPTPVSPMALLIKSMVWLVKQELSLPYL